MAAYNPTNLGFGGSPQSGITEFGGVSDWTNPSQNNATSAINAAQKALTDTTNPPPTTPAPAAAPITAPTNYGVYGGRTGETQGNMFSPQYSAAGNALPGSAAAYGAIVGQPYVDPNFPNWKPGDPSPYPSVAPAPQSPIVDHTAQQQAQKDQQIRTLKASLGQYTDLTPDQLNSLSPDQLSQVLQWGTGSGSWVGTPSETVRAERLMARSLLNLPDDPGWNYGRDVWNNPISGQTTYSMPAPP